MAVLAAVERWLKVGRNEYKLWYEDIAKKSGKSAGSRRRGNNHVVTIVSQSGRQINRLANMRLMKRIKRLEDSLRQPSLYDDQGGLEDFIRYLVHDEMTKAKRKKK